MKKMLVSIALLFLSMFSAQAMEKGNLIGYWEFFQGVASEAAFYLNVDGSCTIFADESGRMTPQERGTWIFADDMLQLTYGGETVRYGMRYTMAEESDENCDTLQLQSDGHAAYFMRKDVPDDFSLNEIVPEEILRISGENHGPYDRLESYLEISGAPDGEYAFLLIIDEEVRMLRAFRYAQGAWKEWLNSSAVVPQGKEKAYLYSLEKGAEFQYNWDLGKTFVSDGLHFGVHTSNGETTQEGISFVWRDGGFHLFDYQFKVGQYVDAVDGELIFWNISNGDERFIQATIETDIHLLAFYALPEKPEDIAQNAAHAPVVSEVKYLNRAFKLSPQELAFKKNQRCNVYMGPGENYERSGGGKAVVSTNDWIQVLARHNDWLLIQYSINDSRYRIGWIEDDALKAGQNVPELPMMIYDKGTLLADTELTDDPLSSKTKVRTVKEGTQVEVLAQLDDAWVYVRYTQGNQTYLGFLPVSVLMFDSNG